jgi:hypothetical protein
MKKYFFFFSFLVLLFGFRAEAVCPVCTVAVGAGVGFSRYLGIDDTIAGLWIGALIVSVSMWTINWMNKKNWKFKGREILVVFLYYAISIWPLYYLEIDGTTVMGHPYNQIWGADKLLVGIIIGSVAFFLSSLWYVYLKKKNDGHAYFPFQKVAMPVASLAILSAVFYFITK